MESRDGEVRQASGQVVAWQTTPVHTHTLPNLLSMQTDFCFLFICLATHPSLLASIQLTHSPSKCLVPASVCAAVLAPGHKCV